MRKSRRSRRHSLSLLLETHGFTVRVFASAREFLVAAPSLRPGALISNIRMPEMDRFEFRRRLDERGFGFPLVVITGQGDVSLAVQMMKAGALDFIEKPFDAEAILNAMAAASERVAETDESPSAVAAAAQLARLTRREVLEGLLAGLPNKSIAYGMAISPRTVEIHRARVMDKTGARSLSELVRLSLAAGMQPRQSR
jgi:two-component system response regulator FixJ